MTFDKSFLTYDKSEDVDKSNDAIRFIRENCDLNQTIVMFSGGKDSLVAMDIATRAGVEKAVYIDSDVEYTISRRYVHQMSEKYNIEFVQPDNDFFEFCRRLSPPSKRLKWCCKVIKLSFMMKYAMANNKLYHITGLRASESNRRASYTDIVTDPFLFANPRYRFHQVNPVLSWSDQEIWDYIQDHNLPPNPLYSMGSERVGCWCCPLATKSEWELARTLEKDGMKKLKNCIHEFALKLPKEYRYKYRKDGWKSFAFKYQKTPVIKMKCEKQTCHLIGDNSYIKKVMNLIFIVDDKYYHKEEGKITFNRGDLQRQQVRMLLEKTLNCVKCGVCLVLCPVGALYLDEDDGIHVDEGKCVGCYSCCQRVDGKLKMGCVARNYKIDRLIIKF
ncbi:MAG: phosphoadenosine phosphosulfate reductase family protein [Methanobacterium sp.]